MPIGLGQLRPQSKLTHQTKFEEVSSRWPNNP
jgi:hypothetical protein